MDRVSVVLGHSSVKVTEKHYSPWVRARQEQLEADIFLAWSGAPTGRAIRWRQAVSDRGRARGSVRVVPGYEWGRSGQSVIRGR